MPGYTISIENVPCRICISSAPRRDQEIKRSSPERWPPPSRRLNWGQGFDREKPATGWRQNYEQYAVYFLRDPESKLIRYIGCSVDPQKRLRQHRSKLSACRGWLIGLKEKGLKPIIETPVGYCYILDAMCLEQRLIALHSLYFPGQLLNRHKCLFSFFGRDLPTSKNLF